MQYLNGLFFVCNLYIGTLECTRLIHKFEEKLMLFESRIQDVRISVYQILGI